MKIILNSEDLKILQMFTSKNEARKQLQGISFKNDGGFLEMVATDGHGLLRIRRKLGEGEEMAEGAQIVLKLPKLKKGSCSVREENSKYILHNNGEESLCQVIEAIYPDYNAILKDWESLPEASDFALFSAENMKRLEAASGNIEQGRPKAKSNRSPHYFNYNYYNRVDYLIVLMPKIG